MPPRLALSSSKVRSNSTFFLLLRPTLLSFHPKMVQPTSTQLEFSLLVFMFAFRLFAVSISMLDAHVKVI